MPLVNAAYEILSDPVKRKQHDEWIAQAEAGLEDPWDHTEQSGPEMRRVERERARGAARGKRVSPGVFSSVVILLLVVVSALLYKEVAFRPMALDTRALAVGPPSLTGGSKEQRGGYTRPWLAPNGMPWPDVSGYVDGYAKLHTGGSTSVTLNNSRNSADVFAKLVAHDGQYLTGVRAVFIKAGERFTLENVRAGTYEIHYLDLNVGIVLKSRQFILQHVPAITSPSAPELFVLLQAAADPTAERFVAPSGDF